MPSRHLLLVLVIVLAIFAAGCSATKDIESKSEFDSLTQRHGMGHLYYIGTESGAHYFASRYFIERTKYYRLPESAYSFQHPFPKTNDESKWVPFLIDLKRKTQGFRGEPEESLQITNSLTVP